MELFDEILGAQPSAASMAKLRSLENEREEVKAFLQRACNLMREARFDTRDLSPAVVRLLADVIPGLLPGSWEGIVPPFTWVNRHQGLDAYLADNPWAHWGPGTVMLDVGCGFPPQTAMEAAQRFPDWQIIGADPCFYPFVLHDVNGDYACIDEIGSVRYFHPAVANAASLSRLYRDRTATYRRFEELFAALRPLLPEGAGGSREVARDGVRLVGNPVKAYESKNLQLVCAGIGDDFAPVGLIRCFNVLYYHDAAFRAGAERWALRTLEPGGLFICGGDGPSTLEARYSVYQRVDTGLQLCEFAFSLDNYRPATTVPWFTLYNDDRETCLLAKLIGVLRRDREYRHDLDLRLDELQSERGIWERQDGYLTAPVNQVGPENWVAEHVKIAEQLDSDGFVERAARILTREGYDSWRNGAGHVACRSP